MPRKTLLASCLLSLSALAQTPPPPPPPQPEAEPVHAAVDVPTEDPGGRFRWGVSGNLGWHAPNSAFTFGAEGRAGYQLSNILSIYGVFGGTLGFGIGITLPKNLKSGSVTGTFLSQVTFGALVEAMFGDLFYVAGGPVLLNGLYTTGEVSVDPAGTSRVSNITSVGWAPALDLRLGLGLGRRPVAPHFRRGGFNIGLDTLIIFRPNATTVTATADVNGNLGAGVTTNGLVVDVVPMLMLGYDGR